MLRSIRLGGIAASPVIALLLAGAGCAVSPEPAPDNAALGFVSSGMVYGPADRRVAVTSAEQAANPWMRSVGYFVNLDAGYCTATLISSRHIITAAHCMVRGQDPSRLYFYPGYRGAPYDSSGTINALDATQPHVQGLRILRGTGGPKAGVLEDYFPGADWAVVELDPSTYVQASSTFTSIASYPAAAFNAPPHPIGPFGLPVSNIGYSQDFFPVYKAAGYDPSCSLTKDGTAVYGASYAGILLSNCDRNSGASGGPIFQSTPSGPQIVATVGGGQDNTGARTLATYSDANANLEVSAASWLWAPFKAAGLVLLADTNNDVDAFVSDADWNGQISTVRANGADGVRPATAWGDFRGYPVTSPIDPRRMSGARAPDGRRFVVTTTSTGAIWMRSEVSPSGAWNGWAQDLVSQGFGSNVADTALTSAGSDALQAYVLTRQGHLYTMHKDIASGPWSTTHDLGIGGALPLGVDVGVTGGYQQAFVAYGTGIKTRWALDVHGDTYSAWTDFGDGLPAGTVPVDVHVGYFANGAMDVYLLADYGGHRVIFERGKASATPGTSWGTWITFASSATYPELTKATQVIVGPRVTAGASRVFILSDGATFAWKAGSPGRWLEFNAPLAP